LGLNVVTVGDADHANAVKAEGLKPGSILSADSADPTVVDGLELALKRKRGGIVTIAPDTFPTMAVADVLGDALDAGPVIGLMQRTVPDLDHTVLRYKRYKSTCPPALSGIALSQEGAAEVIKALKASSEGQSLTTDGFRLALVSRGCDIAAPRRPYCRYRRVAFRPKP